LAEELPLQQLTKGAKKMKEAGNNVTVIISARTTKQLIFKDAFRKVSDDST